MRLLSVVAIASLLCGNAVAADELRLWPGVAPGSENWGYSEENTISPVDHTTSIRNVVMPTIAVHLPPAGKNTGTAVIVIPGGGFETLAYVKEGDSIAAWLNSIGVAAFVLKYRIAHTEPGLGDTDRNARVNAVVPLAIADGKKALHIVRNRAAEWGLNPDRIGVMGFSAGGYLSIILGSNYDTQTRPAFVAAIYSGSPLDLKVPGDAPPLFLAYAVDDPRVPRDSLGALNAWSKANVPVELHAYAKGGHGFALRKQGLPVNSWNERFVDWLKWAGFLSLTAYPAR